MEGAGESGEEDPLGFSADSFMIYMPAHTKALAFKPKVRRQLHVCIDFPERECADAEYHVRCVKRKGSLSLEGQASFGLAKFSQRSPPMQRDNRFLENSAMS